VQQENKNTAMPATKSNVALWLKSVLLIKKNSEDKIPARKRLNRATEIFDKKGTTIIK
jgi:hypothetical protein